jgi:hypothetical protein
MLMVRKSDGKSIMEWVPSLYMPQWLTSPHSTAGGIIFSADVIVEDSWSAKWGIYRRGVDEK